MKRGEDSAPIGGPLGCGEFLRTAGCLGAFYLGGVVFAWIFGSAEMYGAMIFVGFIVFLLVWLWVVRPWLTYGTPRWLQRSRPRHDAPAPRRRPRTWVEVEWPHEDDEDARPMRHEWVKVDGKWLKMEWPEEDDERRY